MFSKLISSVYEMKIKSNIGDYAYVSIPEIVEKAEIAVPAGSIDEKNFNTDTLYSFKTDDGYDFYYNRIRMHLINTEGLFGIEVFISADEEHTFRVYTWSRETMLSGNKIQDEQYISGSWNKYFFTNFRELIRSIFDCEECIRFDKIFKTVA